MIILSLEKLKKSSWYQLTKLIHHELGYRFCSQKLVFPFLYHKNNLRKTNNRLHINVHTRNFIEENYNILIFINDFNFGFQIVFQDNISHIHWLFIIFTCVVRRFVVKS